MDIASVVGILVGIVALAYSVIAAGSSFSVFYDLPSMICVFGGAAAAMLMCYPLKNVLAMPKVLLKAFFNKAPHVPELIETLVKLAETARRDGLLALEAKLEEIDNPFIALGIQMAVDGTQPDMIEAILRCEMDATSSRHKDGKAVIDALGRFAPAFGMIGTLLGLIIMLGNMSDPDAIGPGMAVALITTLYGAVLSNLLTLPFAEKLGYYNKLELEAMEVVLVGILGIQSGENPRLIEQKLNSYLPPKLRAGAQEKAA